MSHTPFHFDPLDTILDAVLVELNCKTRILVVVDGLNFSDTSPSGLGKALDAVEHTSQTNHPVSLTKVSKSNFTFSDASLKNVEEVWLFGIGSQGTLPAAEREALERFMDAGGGIFATGDHADLGRSLCGSIKRVRSMRRWSQLDGSPHATAPLGSGGWSGRIDTNAPSNSGYKTSLLQSDATPQRIYPLLYGQQPQVSFHDVLRRHDGLGPVSFLPDHNHEGLVEMPSVPDPQEFPGGIHPEVIAWGVSAGAGDKDPVPVKTFGVIGAYDGQKANVGRIVVDSTWHHWVNYNLIGLDPMGGTPAPEYEQIRDYFENVAGWLEPSRVRLCLKLPWFLKVLFAYPLLEELDGSEEFTLSRAAEVGRIVTEQLTSAYRTTTTELLTLILPRTELPSELAGLLEPGMLAGEPDLAVPPIPIWVQPSFLADVTIGGAVMRLSADMPRDIQDAHDAVRHLTEGEDHENSNLRHLLTEGAVHGLRLASEALGSEAEIGKLIEVISAAG